MTLRRQFRRYEAPLPPLAEARRHPRVERRPLRKGDIMRLIGRCFVAVALLAGPLAVGPLAAGRAAEPPSPELQLFREIYKELVEINTTDSTGDTVKAAEAMAARLRTAVFPADDVHV